MKSFPQIKDIKIKSAEAISAAGNKSKLAKILGINRSSVQDWGEYVPKTQAYRVAQAFPGLISDTEAA